MPVWSQTAWFSDGYHGGVYAHYPMWQARFTIEKLIDLIPMASPHKGYFDSELTECGPPAVLTKDGIVLIYNGKNKAGAEGDTIYKANAYCAVQILFDKNDPYKVIDRLDTPFLIPEEPFE